MPQVILLALFSLLVAPYPDILATTRHVPSDYPAIQAGINAAVNGDTVLVAPGTYTENINYHGKNIVVMSNYAISHNPEDIFLTIIDGSQPVDPDTGSCVLMIDGEDSTAALDGFTLTGGTGTPLWDDGGSGVFIEGGGILIEDASPVIRNNYIIANEATRTYQGIVSAGGGGIKVGFSSSLIVNNVIIENEALYGGGMCINWASPTVKNNVFIRNFGGQSFAGGGLAVFGNNTHHSIFDNNVVAGNSSTLAGGGIKIWGGVLESHNNIIWGNRANVGAQQISGSIANAGMTYSCIQGGWNGTGNIDLYPGFFRLYLLLAETSPCIDTGDPDSAYNDGGGTSRADMGVWGGPYSNTLFLFPSDPHFFVISSMVNFGAATVGVPDTAWLPLQNRGVGDVVLDSAIAAPVAIIEFPDTIPPFENDTLGLVWTPEAAGDLNAQLLIYHNDANISWPYTVLLTGSAALDADDNAPLVHEFRVEQNYPNPFNPTTTIFFSLPQSGQATLTVYDIMGRNVKTLMNDVVERGHHAVEFNASPLPSGIYFYRLESAGQFLTRKMILLK